MFGKDSSAISPRTDASVGTSLEQTKCKFSDSRIVLIFAISFFKAPDEKICAMPKSSGSWIFNSFFIRFWKKP